MIGIIDYGMGNLGSVVNALKYINQDARIIVRPENAADCHALIVPGVGSFGDCSSHLSENGFTDLLKEWISSGKPIMGICLGLQILFETSEESKNTSGLSIFKGTVKRFDHTHNLKVPQIGWNKLHFQNSNCPMFKDIDNESYFYLVHSFYVEPLDEAIIAGKTNYGLEYCSCLWSDNVFATQFHPEKSQKIGLKMLQNFCDWSINV